MRRWCERIGYPRFTPHIKTFGRYRLVPPPSQIDQIEEEENEKNEHKEGKDKMEVHLTWFMLSSHNLSKSAWGQLQKENSQYWIPSFEMGVLFLPQQFQPTIQERTNGENEEEKEVQIIEDDEEEEREVEEFSLTPHHHVLGSHCLLPQTTSRSSSNHPIIFKAASNIQEMVDWERNLSPEVQNIIVFPIPHEIPAQKYAMDDQPWVWDKSYLESDLFGETYQVG